LAPQYLEKFDPARSGQGIAFDYAWLTAISDLQLGTLAVVHCRLEEAREQMDEALELSLAIRISSGLSGRRLLWSGSVVLPPGGVHNFADELFEDVFEGDYGLSLAVVVDEAGEVGTATT
jgi:hypothetical protein